MAPVTKIFRTEERMITVRIGDIFISHTGTSFPVVGFTAWGGPILRSAYAEHEWDKSAVTFALMHGWALRRQYPEAIQYPEGI